MRADVAGGYQPKVLDDIAQDDPAVRESPEGIGNEIDSGEAEADYFGASASEPLRDLQRRHAVTLARHASLQERHRELLERLWDREHELAHLPALEEAGLESEQLEALLRLIFGSRSWRYTRPCRWAGRLLRSVWAVARR
jgi:hypothetical protein